MEGWGIEIVPPAFGWCIVLVGGLFIFVVQAEYVCTVWIDGNESIEPDVTRTQRFKYILVTIWNLRQFETEIVAWQ